MKNHRTQVLCFVALLLSSIGAVGQSFPKLNSLQSAQPQPTIFLDFDGQTVQTAAWQSGNAFTCNPAALTADQVTEIFNRVSEDYRPFAVNITTDSALFIAAPANKRIRIIVTPTSAWTPGAGGVSYNNSFTWGSNVPGFVFSDRLFNNAKFIAECCSHEAGHTLGLSHQSKYDGNCSLTETYNTGIGTGLTSWAPIMGNSYGKNITGWNNGPTPSGCTGVQDNLTIITTQNGFGFRDDDYAETMDNNTTALNSISFNVQGLISTATDKDAFKINLNEAGNIHIEAAPYSVGSNTDGANVDLLLMLYNNNNQLIKVYDPSDNLNVVVDTALTAGTYYILVDGTANANTSNYGSIGSYTLSGFRGALPIHSVSLQGRVNKNMHNLTWQIIADEPIAKQVLEASTNGIDYTPILTDVTGLNTFSYNAKNVAVTYYRLKATSIINQTMFSNLVVLKNNAVKLFSVNTLVQNQINVQATEQYQYKLYDVNARLLVNGSNNKGSNNINIANLSNGFYILQMLSNGYTQTERILKQ